MLCDNCKKNEATIHIKEVHDGKITTSNLCGDCAKAKEEKGEETSNYSSESESNGTLADSDQLAALREQLLSEKK